MIVILNSDVIFSKALRRTGLPGHVKQFLQKCASAGHRVIIPHATRLEFEKAQEDAREKEISKLREALDALRVYDVDLPDLDLEILVPEASFENLLNAIDSLDFAFEAATIDDYDVALRKACRRELPHPPSIASDEMRDLVIWQTSLRLSEQHGGAILISRDEVHSHHRGDIEAAARHLLRAREFEIAEEMLNLETASAARIKALLESQWPAIRAMGLPIVDGAAIIAIKAATFLETDYGTTTSTFVVKFNTGSGEEIECDASIEFVENTLFEIDISHNGARLYRDFDVDADDSDYEQRLADLLETLGESDES